MSEPSNFKRFVNRNLVLIVMVPMLISIHWGWYTLQKNPKLVDPSQRTDPYTVAMNYIKNKWEGKKPEEKESP